MPCIPPLLHHDKCIIDLKGKAKLFDNFFAEHCSNFFAEHSSIVRNNREFPATL